MTTTDTTADLVAARVMADTTAYATADTGTKARIRAALDRDAKAALRAGDFPTAQALMGALDSCTTAKVADKPVIDFSQVLADRIATLRLAADMLEDGSARPDGIASDVTIGDKVGVADADTARKIAGAKITRSTERRSIQAAVDRAFAGVKSGTFLTVRQIAAAGSLDDYTPSDGAVAARLFPTDDDGVPTTCTLTGVVPVPATATTGRGARKA